MKKIKIKYIYDLITINPNFPRRQLWLCFRSRLSVFLVQQHNPIFTEYILLHAGVKLCMHL